MQTLRLIHKQIDKLIKTILKQKLSNKVVKFFRTEANHLKFKYHQVSAGVHVIGSLLYLGWGQAEVGRLK